MASGTKETGGTDPGGPDPMHIGTTGGAAYPGRYRDPEAGEPPVEKEAEPGGADSLVELLLSPITDKFSDEPPAPDMGEPDPQEHRG